MPGEGNKIPRDNMRELSLTGGYPESNETLIKTTLHSFLIFWPMNIHYFSQNNSS